MIEHRCPFCESEVELIGDKFMREYYVCCHNRKEEERLTQEIKEIIQKGDDNPIPIICKPPSDKEIIAQDGFIRRILFLDENTDPSLDDVREAFRRKYGMTLEEALDDNLRETEDRLGFRVRWNDDTKEFEYINLESESDD